MSAISIRRSEFYTRVLGVKFCGARITEGRFTNCFVGYGDAVLELTHNWDIKSCEPGTGYGDVAVEVEDAYRACDEVIRRGGKVTRPAGPMKHGTTVIAFVQDPDGYKIEFVQRKPA